MSERIQKRTVISTLVKYMMQHLEKAKKLDPELTNEDLISIAGEFDMDDEVEDAYIKVRKKLREGEEL